jgi:hypothetical protein
MAIDWQDAAKGTLLVGLILYVGYGAVQKMFPKAPKKQDAVATKLGLQYRRDVWKGEAWWEGIWAQFPVRAHIMPTATPSILVGAAPGKEVRWMAMDRKLEGMLVPLKGEPDPMPTGDRRFDERFNLRIYDAGNLSAVTAPIRNVLLEAGPETVSVGPEGLEYLFDEGVTGPKLQKHLDAATSLARLVGLDPGFVPSAEAAP